MRHSNRGGFCRSRTTVRGGRLRPMLEELEGRVTPSTGPDLHPTQVLAAQIASPNPGLDAHTTITIDPAGHVAAFWEDSLPSAAGPVIHGEVNGSPTFTVSTAGSIAAATSDTSGDVAVAWESHGIINGVSGGYYLSFFSATGTTLGGPVYLGPIPFAGASAQVSVAGDSAGHFMAVWQTFSGFGWPDGGVAGQVFDAHGNALAPAFTVTPSQQQFLVSNPAVAADVGGGFVALWQTSELHTSTGAPGGVNGQRFDAAGNAVGAPFMVSAVSDPGIAVNNESLRVASDGAGNLVAVWSVYTENTDSHFEWAAFAAIDGQRFTDQGVLQGGMFQVNTSPIMVGSLYTIVPGVAMDGGDNVEVVYASANDNSLGNSIYAQRYGPTGSPIGSLARLNTAGDIGGVSDHPPTLAPTVAADHGGDFVFGWAQAGYATAVVYTGSATNRAPHAVAPFAPADLLAWANVGYRESQSYFTDPDGDTLTYTATLANGSPLPAWLNLGDDGRLWGTPDSSAAGMTYQVKVTASDPYGASASQVLPLAVRPDASQPNGGQFAVNISDTGFPNPKTAVNAAGDSIIVWGDGSSPTSRLMGQVYNSQHQAVGTAFVIQTSANAIYFATVTADAAGNFDVAWPDGQAIYLRRISDLGVALGNPVVVVPNAGGNILPRLAADATGGLALTWTNELPGPAGVNQVFVQRFDVLGHPLSSVVQLSASGDQPGVAVSPSGNILVVWDSYDRTIGAGSAIMDSNVQVMTQLFDAHLNPRSSPVPAGPGSTYAGVENANPTVAADGLGNFDVAWVIDGISHFGEDIDMARFDNLGMPIPSALGGSGPVQVNAFSRGNQDHPQVVADGSGNFTVVWTSAPPGNAGIFGQRYNVAGRPVGGEFRLDANITSSVGFPAIATDAAGDLLAVWENWTAHAGIAGQWFQPTATVHVPAAQSTTVNHALIFSTANGDAITITGGDPNQVETLAMLVNPNTGAALTPTLTVTHITGLASITGNSTTHLTLTGTRAALNAALEGLTFNSVAIPLHVDLKIRLAPNGAMLVEGDVSITVLPNAGTLPTGWSDLDVNGSYPAGSASFAGGTWTVAGGGNGIAGTADWFNFASRSVTGNTTISAKLISFNGTNYSAFAGLMLRNSTAAGDLFVDMGYTPQWGAWMEWRTTVNGTVSNTNVFTVPAPSSTQPLWLKLVQNGTAFTGYESANGVSWTLVGSTTVALNANALAGLAVTSEYDAPVATATFSNVALNLPSGWSDQDVNGSHPPGAASYGAGTWTVAGGGNGIVGRADQFNFASKSVTVNTTITAELTSFNGTNYSAFAGLMLRNSTAAGDLFVDMGYTPQWGAWMEWRTTVNGIVRNTNVFRVTPPSSAHPLWLKLVQTGTTFTGYESADGVSWTTVGSTTVALNMNALAGLAVTSEYNAPLVTATFTNVGVFPIMDPLVGQAHSIDAPPQQQLGRFGGIRRRPLGSPTSRMT